MGSRSDDIMLEKILGRETTRTVVAEATRGQQPTSWRPSETIGEVKGRIPKALPPVQPPFRPGLMLVTGITVMLVVALIREVMT